MKAIEHIWAYIDGKPVQRQEITGADGKDLIPDPETKRLTDEAISNYLGE